MRLSGNLSRIGSASNRAGRDCLRELQAEAIERGRQTAGEKTPASQTPLMRYRLGTLLIVLAVLPPLLGWGYALDKVADDVQLAVLFAAHLVNRNDMRMTQLARGAGFAQERFLLLRTNQRAAMSLRQLFSGCSKPRRSRSQSSRQNLDVSGTREFRTARRSCWLSARNPPPGKVVQALTKR